jgi:hypothetical protein
LSEKKKEKEVEKRIKEEEKKKKGAPHMQYPLYLGSWYFHIEGTGRGLSFARASLMPKEQEERSSSSRR